MVKDLPLTLRDDAVQISGTSIDVIALERADRSAVDPYLVLTVHHRPLGSEGLQGQFRPIHLSLRNARTLAEQLLRSVQSAEEKLLVAGTRH